MCGEKDEPIWFDDEWMKGEAAGNIAAAVGQGGNAGVTVQGVVDGKLDEVDLKALTRLDALGGTFI